MVSPAEKPKVCFYGFDDQELGELLKKAEGAGMRPVFKMTPQVKYVVLSKTLIDAPKFTKDEFLSLLGDPKFTDPVPPPKDFSKVCFTGFPDSEKQQLQFVAQNAGMKVVQSISKSLGLLVVGSSPGPKKIRLAEEYGIKILSKPFFVAMVENGIPVNEVEGEEIRQKILSVGDTLSLPHGIFVAIDFETADYKLDSACAVGAVRAENGVITEELYRLIKPPRQKVRNTHIHGLDWDILQNEKSFGEVWQEVLQIVSDADYLVAHNVRFDRSVMAVCCGMYHQNLPSAPFVCTLRGARQAFSLNSYSLPSLCEAFDIPNPMHHALEDAKAALAVLSVLHKNNQSLQCMLMEPIAARAAPVEDSGKKEDLKKYLLSLSGGQVLEEGDFQYLCHWLENEWDRQTKSLPKPAFEIMDKIVVDGIAMERELKTLRSLLERANT